MGVEAEPCQKFPQNAIRQRGTASLHLKRKEKRKEVMKMC